MIELKGLLDEKYLRRLEEACDNIKSMKVRGAGRIARYAAETLKIMAKNMKAKDSEEFISGVIEVARRLVSTRPTAVSLPNSMRFVVNRVLEDYEKGKDLESLRDSTVKYCSEFIRRSLEAMKNIAEIGSRRIKDGYTIMTHCHSTVAVEIIKQAWKSGKKLEVYVKETRPRYQGRITAKALAAEGIPVTLIVDSAARYFMKDVDLVVVGADTVAVNGAVVNKIGTSELALVAKEARVNVMVGAETYKFDPKTLTGELVEIEERPPEEVVPPNVLKEIGPIKVRNPAFDVTPAEYIDVIVTEKGVIPPQAAFLIMKEEFRVSIPHAKDPWERGTFPKSYL